MDYRKIISIDSSKRGGQPTIRGMRITVYDVLKMLSSGMTHQDIITDFPELTTEDIFAVLAYASDREKKMSISLHMNSMSRSHEATA